MYNGSEDRVQYWQARSQSGEIIWLQMEYRFAFAAEMHLFRFNSWPQVGNRAEPVAQRPATQVPGQVPGYTHQGISCTKYSKRIFAKVF